MLLTADIFTLVQEIRNRVLSAASHIQNTCTYKEFLPNIAQLPAIIVLKLL